MPDHIFEIRCPVHGFVPINAWERDIISQAAFQRLRRIRQLAWTDEVYPGAMHTRFEHSLGVMHTTSLLYDAIWRNGREVLENELQYNDAGQKRYRQFVRLAALLHDVGHCPFSHAAEELFPDKPNGKKFVHEEYSAEIIRTKFSDVIDRHPANKNFDFRATQIAALIEGSIEAGSALFWKELVSGQMDADRMDYLLRDSHHIGVNYVKFDLQRLISSVTVVPGLEGATPRLGIQEGGWHAAEALVLARYFMFTQVYFHKTRVAYDIHVREAMRTLLPFGTLPKPVAAGIEEFLRWDDWRVLGLLADGQGGEHGLRLSSRNHYRLIYQTPEVCLKEDLNALEVTRQKLGSLLAEEMRAGKNWYKTGNVDISVVSDLNQKSFPLSQSSNMLRGMKANNQSLLYVRPEDRDKAKKRLSV